MSQLQTLTAAPRADVIPGKVLAPFRLKDIGFLEGEFERQHLVQAGAAAAELSDKIAKFMVDTAMGDIKTGAFNYGGAGFDARCFHVDSLPLLLWRCLAISDPAITHDEAAKLITPENESKVHRAVLEALGFKFSSPSSPNADAPPTTAAPSTGATSSADSVSAA